MDYSKKTREELISLCKHNGIKGYSGKKKEELLQLLSNPTPPEAPTTETFSSIVKPILKWVGGKSQILDTVLELIPKDMVNYHEPFLGGGSVLLGVLSMVKAGKLKISGKIYASDLNPNIIAFYRNIQGKVEEFITECKKYVAEYSSCKGSNVNRALESIEDLPQVAPESYYYWVRKQFNTMTQEERETPHGSAMLLFLNKTCFRGVYRESPRGFNVPYGNYKNPTILDETHVRKVSTLLQGIILTAQPFAESLATVATGDFVYLDPPYAPENETSFVSYTADGFGIDNHKNLFQLCNTLCGKSVKLVMSNADVKFVKDSFPTPTYQTKIISCRRAIHSKNPESRTNEVLITNGFVA